MICKICKGTLLVTRVAREAQGGKVVREWTYVTECPCRAGRGRV